MRFDESDARPLGRTARGVRGIRLAQGHRVIAMIILPSNQPVADTDQDTDQDRGIVGQEGINAHRMLTCQMIVNYLIGNRQQQTLIANTTFDARLVTNAGFPLVSTGGRITGLTFFRLPAKWIEIGTASEQTAEKHNPFCYGKMGATCS